MNPNPSDPCQLSITQLLEAYRCRQLSPVEVVGAYLDRIASLDPALHAYVEVYAEGALALACASEQRLVSGLPTGLLEGVPLALKDLIDVAGQRTTAGTTIHAGRGAAARTATVAARLLAAGAIPLGKVHLVELAYGGWGTNQGMGTPRNPWDMRIHRTPGGSSSGSGVAVAAGLAAGALGTDTGGSVRIPSAFCGLTGLRPTQGRISNYGVEPVSHTLDTVGPMTWTARDAALLLQAMHGPDFNDPATLAVPPQDFLSGLDAGVAGLRFSVGDPAAWGEVEPAILAAVHDAAEVLRALGCLHNDAPLAAIDYVADQEASGIIISSESYAAHGVAVAASQVAGDAASRARIMRGASIAAPDYAAALALRQDKARALRRVFDQTDVLVLPCLPVTARPVAALDENDLSPSRLTRFVGYYGLSALALPCGLSPEGLPVSVQLVAGPYREDLLLRIGAAFQAATAHHLRRPRLDAPAQAG